MINQAEDYHKRRNPERAAKTSKGKEMSPEEITQKTDEELLEIYYAKQREMHAQMDVMYQQVSDNLKVATNEDERQKHLKRKEMIEKRKQKMKDAEDKRAQKVRAH